MTTLALAIYDEGRTDARFLAPLLQRVCEVLAFEIGPKPCDIFEVQRLEDVRDAPSDRDARIFRAAHDMRDAWDILFIHTDGASDHKEQAANCIAPAIERIVGSGAFDARQRCVPVVPVRETEAWMLADTDALREAWRVSKPSSEQLTALRQIKRVEQITDPKTELERLYRLMTGRNNAAKTLDAIAQHIEITKLQDLPSFQRMESALRDAIRHVLCGH
jgi:hypothetical protein